MVPAMLRWAAGRQRGGKWPQQADLPMVTIGRSHSHQRISAPNEAFGALLLPRMFGSCCHCALAVARLLAPLRVR
jgi:hypothetical protein